MSNNKYNIPLINTFLLLYELLSDNLRQYRENLGQVFILFATVCA
jgi:hypothetical protein